MLLPLELTGYWLALLHVLICRLLPAFGLRTLAEFFFSLGREEDSALRLVLVEAVVAVW